MLNIISKYKYKPVVNEVEFHPYLFQKDLKHFCDLENIKIFAYNPLTKGNYPKKINFQNKYEGYLEAALNFLSKEYKLTRDQIVVNCHMKLGIIPILGLIIKKPKVEDISQATESNNIIKDNFNAEVKDIDQKYIDLLCSFTENQYRLNNGYDIFGINIFA